METILDNNFHIYAFETSAQIKDASFNFSKGDPNFHIEFFY